MLYREQAIERWRDRGKTSYLMEYNQIFKKLLWQLFFEYLKKLFFILKALRFFKIGYLKNYYRIYMQLSFHQRDKKETRKLRRLNNIPAVVYAKGEKNENIYLNQAELKKILATLKPGDLSVNIFTLKNKKESFKAIIKDIQYFVTSYDISHIDFMKLDDKREIEVNVPIRITGLAACKGIKIGGNFRQVIRSVKVKCLPKDLPKEFILDISEMEIGGNKRISDIEMPKNVKCAFKNVKEVVVAVTKR